MVMVDDSHATGYIGAPAAAPPSTAACRAAST
jgi:7-keto-8-aminopelargonate synthetase-like enzyme